MLDITSAASLPGYRPQSKFGAVLRATGGNFLEMFDFFLFGIYAAPIGKAFFATGNEYFDTSIAFIVFWFGALMRPLGAIYLGAYVDSLGRRKGLIVTLGIMAMGTVIIAVTPSYATIGVAAPIIVVLGRLLQGFSAGVELGGVSVYLAEIATPRTQGLRHLVPVGEPAGRGLRRRADRLHDQPDARPGGDRRLGLAHPVPDRLPDRAADLHPARLAAGDAGIPGQEGAIPSRAEIYRALIANCGRRDARHADGDADDGLVLFHHRLHARFRQDAEIVGERLAAGDAARRRRQFLLAADRRRRSPTGSAASRCCSPRPR